MHRRRSLAIALSTVALVAGSVVVGGAPADAAGTTYQLYLTGRAIDGYRQGTIVRASGARGDTLKVGSKYRYRGSSAAPKGKVTLQRKVGSGTWKTIKKAKQSSRYFYSAKLPAYTVPASVAVRTVKYRFRSARSVARGVLNTDYSATFTVKYENPAHYTGFQRTVYDYIAPYCPTVAVHLDRGIAADGAAGEFQWQRGISIDDTTVGAYSPAWQQGVALHECAHYHQFSAFGMSATGWKAMEKHSPSVFVNDVDPATNAPDFPVAPDWEPLEHAADCASHAVQPAGYLGYGGYCNPTELAVGLALLTRNAKY
ncbi:hypothetical protein QT381_10745 [Galbitalea sp. SE-J8]|uniref:hypothetical protein n=1 Tax=Galbitalea sp. SE-J8 TaxID=3054952 RepID=UPI00259CCAAA|nr:hypothetical protein [Galbitalea sp. SE-J8]MDM4763487.1 hypothetical protein [Galbitalea sp. SE-J8]